MNIIFFGNPEFCKEPLQKLYHSNHEIISVVTSTDRKSGRGLKFVPTFVKKYSQSLNLTLIETDDLNDKSFKSKLSFLKPDLFVVVAFKILPNSILNIPKYGSINIHPSILPKYRGSSPIQYSLLNGDKDTGVSIIKLNSKIDAGDILGQIKSKINENSTFGELHNSLSLLGSELMIDVLNKIEKNKIKPIKQKNEQKTLAPKIKKSDLQINWNEPVLNIHNKIRAFDPYPGAFCFYNNKRIKLFNSKIYHDKINETGLPGKIFIKDDKFCILCKDRRYLHIQNIQLEGKQKVETKDFIQTLAKNRNYLS